MIDALKSYGHNMTYSKFRVGGAAVQVSSGWARQLYRSVEGC